MITLKSLLAEGGALKAVGLASVAMAATPSINSMSIPFFGVPLTVLAMATAGATISFAYGKPIESRAKLFTMAIANTFVAAASVAIVPHALGLTWLSDKLQAPTAFLIAVLARHVVPAVIELVPEIIQKIFKLRQYHDSSRSNSYGSIYDKYYGEDNNLDQDVYEDEEYYEQVQAKPTQPKRKARKAVRKS